MPVKTRRTKLTKTVTSPVRFDLESYLLSGGRKRAKEHLSRNAVAFSQGSPADDVFYIQRGGVKLSVISGTGKEAVVAMLGAGDFFGEGC